MTTETMKRSSILRIFQHSVLISNDSEILFNIDLRLPPQTGQQRLLPDHYHIMTQQPATRVRLSLGISR